jgi:hypothetical protein
LRTRVSSSEGRILANPLAALNLCRRWQDHFCGREIFFKSIELEPGMSKVVRVSTSIPASKISSRESDHHQLISIALFSGIGLLVSLIAVLLGVPGMWF